MFQTNIFLEVVLYDNVSANSFASVSSIYQCQVSSHHGIISIISFQYFPTKTIATYRFLLILTSHQGGANGATIGSLGGNELQRFIRTSLLNQPAWRTWKTHHPKQQQQSRKHLQPLSKTVGGERGRIPRNLQRSDPRFTDPQT